MSRARRWLLRDRNRVTVAMIAATVVGVIASQGAFRLAGAPAAQLPVIAILAGWIAFSLSHAVAVSWAYRDLEGHRFRQALAEDAGGLTDGGTFTEFVAGKTISSWGLTSAFMALTGVLVLIFLPTVRGNPVFLVLGGTLVVCAWVDMLVTYAAYYARKHIGEGGFAFPGEGGTSMEDFLYFASAVQTTFGTTDVTVVSTSMRRTVRIHAMLAFAFNTVIVALLVSLVLTLG